MSLLDIYRIGKKSPLKFSIKFIDDKLKFVEFPYSSQAVVGASIGIWLISTLLAMISYGLGWNEFFMFFFIFVGYLMAIAAFIYPVNIFYTTKSSKG